MNSGVTDQERDGEVTTSKSSSPVRIGFAAQKQTQVELYVNYVDTH